jgi:hypothetical protein
MSHIEARRQAMLKFGGVEAIKQDYRAERGLPFIENLLQDLRFGLRMLRKSPGFTAVAVVTLAVAIGANAVVFGVLNAMVLRPLSVPQAQSLYGLERGSDNAVNQSYPDYLDLRDRNRSFEDLAAYNVTSVGLDTGNNPSAAWKRLGTTSTRWAFSRISGVSSMVPMSMAQIAPRLSCSRTRIGTAIFKTIAA